MDAFRLILPLPQPGGWSSTLGTGAFCLFASVCVYILEGPWESRWIWTCPQPDYGISAFGWPRWEQEHRNIPLAFAPAPDLEWLPRVCPRLTDTSEAPDYWLPLHQANPCWFGPHPALPTTWRASSMRSQGWQESLESFSYRRSHPRNDTSTEVS